MIPYVQPVYYAFFEDRLIAQYHALKPLIEDVLNMYADYLSQNDIIIKNRALQIITTLRQRPQRVDSNNSNMWASSDRF